MNEQALFNTQFLSKLSLLTDNIPLEFKLHVHVSLQQI